MGIQVSVLKLTQNENCVILGTMKMPNIPKNLRNNQFSFREAIRAGLTKRALKRLMEDGVLERVELGIYQRTAKQEDLPEERYRTASLRCGFPSSICLLSALEHYHLTDQIPKHVWILVPSSKRSAFKELRLLRSREPQWDIGIKKTKKYWITTPERTIVDCLIHRRLIGNQVAIEALKKAISLKKVKLGNVLDMAKKMGVEHRVLPYIEALSS